MFFAENTLGEFMPKFSDLADIRNEILNIGDERTTLEEWGEPFDPLPLPPEAGSFDASENLGDTADTAEADLKTNDFEDALSKLDLDELMEVSNSESTAEVPEEFLSEDLNLSKGLDDQVQDVDETQAEEIVPPPMDFEFEDLEKSDGESIFADGSEINDDLFVTTDFNADADTVDEISTSLDFPDFDSLDVDAPIVDDLEVDAPFADNLDLDVPLTDDLEMDSFSDIDIQDADISLDDNLPPADFLSEDKEDTTEDLQVTNLSLASSGEELSLDPDSMSFPDEAEDPYAPVEELKDVEIPEIDEETGFAKKEEVAPVTFTPPQRFQKFADDSGQVLVQAKTTVSGEDVAGDIPLAISEQDLKKFVKAVENMPLNLRQEIQHYIAYEDDLEVNKMELVDLVLKDASLKKIARYLESALKKSIKVPKGFDKKSVEEFEREKKTFKYKFKHQILPLATMALIITLLIGSIFVIAWHFIYNPIMAENYYKDGLFYIHNGKNATAIEKFDKAGTYWKKKRWYFRYASEFREKKQYSAAEAIYLRLLTDFDHDVEGGIAYADMLSRELRDYEKAETVLRRQVIDYHPQSSKAFYALANVYLDWGLENSAKLEEAKKIFDQLLLEDGSNNLYNAGLMKYYIRTDNLAKVLPFKDFFLEKHNKLSQEDFNELASYLITCRYEPSKNITPALQEQIHDLREVLEQALKLNENNAEANYNLGRFFVYNYKNNEAEYYLKKAYENYDDKILPLAQFFKKLDAMRLYGEIFLQKEQHLEAETIFASALNLYRSYAAISEIPPNKIVGKLFEDYGDVKYFIASDYEMALECYTKATEQNADSASVRYKLGYINYQMGNYNQAATEFGLAFADKPSDVNLLFALGNALFKRADYYVAQAYYERLVETLNAEKIRRRILLPQVRENDTIFVENYMKATNNLAVTLNRLAVQNGNSEMNSRSFALFAESTRAWDALTRHPKTLIRTKNRQAPAYINVQYMSVSDKNFIPEIYTEIPLNLENARALVQVK